MTVHLGTVAPPARYTLRLSLHDILTLFLPPLWGFPWHCCPSTHRTVTQDTRACLAASTWAPVNAVVATVTPTPVSLRLVPAR